MSEPATWSRTRLFILLALCALLPAVVLGRRWLGARADSLVPLLAPGSSASRNMAMPADAVLLNAAATSALTPPFAVARTTGAAPGKALLLPDGRGTSRHAGRAALPFTVTAAGDYRLWLRVRWQDECGNSLRVRVDGSRPLLAGNDAVFEQWHWISLHAPCRLQPGRHRLELLEREDGIAVDQLLFTRARDFAPVGVLGARQAPTGLRLFADTFTRSPGQGNDAWDTVAGAWRIAFSFDPNRVPNQYALVGKAGAAGQQALALLAGPAWHGLALGFSLRPEAGSTCGAVLESARGGPTGLRICFSTGDAGTRLCLQGAGQEQIIELGSRLRPGQWHRVQVERWAWLLRVRLDGRVLLERADLPPRAGRIGLGVDAGTGVFDDVRVQEIPWLADDGHAYKAPWIPQPGAQWFRSRAGPQAPALVGRHGRISLRLPGLPVRALALWEQPRAGVRVFARGLREQQSPAHMRLLVPASDSPALPASLELEPAAGEARVARVAVALGQPAAEVFRIAPYAFSTNIAQDISDFLDFTPAEYRQMRQSPEAQKLKRRPRRLQVVGRGEKCAWQLCSGYWQVSGGTLEGRGPGALLRLRQAIGADVRMRLRVRLASTDACADIGLHVGARRKVRVRLATGQAPAGAPRPDAALRLDAGDTWHALEVATRGERLRLRLDGKAAGEHRVTRADGEAVYLKVLRGRVLFDDIAFTVQRRGHGRFYYAFDRRETDWWREGGEWIDHAGISCAIASSWISLQAPGGRGYLWNKRAFTGDLSVAFNIQENSEWFGWDQPHSHVHYPFDNICAVLAPVADPSRGYRLEVNSRQRTATVLYRDGREVAVVRQDGAFPIRYRGGHMPYAPRINRIRLAKQGRHVRAWINGRLILDFTDPDPLPVRRVAIGGYHTRVNFAEVLVACRPRE